MSHSSRILLVTGILCTALSMYQLLVLELAHFYAMFSLGITMILLVIHAKIVGRPLFTSSEYRRFLSFFTLLLATSILIDRIGMRLGYWEYPHYDEADTIRKYVFEWTIALFYHFLAFVVGIEIFRRAGADRRLSMVVSLLVVVGLVGFLTESLNLKVYSWRVKSMPISDITIGSYFLIFQTLGYWLMALIPYGLYEITGLKERSPTSERLD